MILGGPVITRGRHVIHDGPEFRLALPSRLDGTEQSIHQISTVHLRLLHHLDLVRSRGEGGRTRRRRRAGSLARAQVPRRRRVLLSRQILSAHSPPKVLVEGDAPVAAEPQLFHVGGMKHSAIT